MCALIDKDGGIGMLINNVGFNEDRPLPLEEFTDEAVDAMLHCNIHSTVGKSKIEGYISLYCRCLI